MGSYSIVTSGRHTDYSAFWKYFDNYIVTAAHNEYLDEQIMGWYLTDDCHKDFYHRIFDSFGSTRLVLFYRQASYVPKKRNGRGSFVQKIADRQRVQSRIFLAEQGFQPKSERKECVGFCIFDWNRQPGSSAWILALSTEGLNGNNPEKAELWKTFEKWMKLNGIYQVETGSYQVPEFWEHLGFDYVSSHVMRKKI